MYRNVPYQTRPVPVQSPVTPVQSSPVQSSPVQSRPVQYSTVTAHYSRLQWWTVDNAIMVSVRPSVCPSGLISVHGEGRRYKLQSSPRPIHCDAGATRHFPAPPVPCTDGIDWHRTLDSVAGHCGQPTAGVYAAALHMVGRLRGISTSDLPCHIHASSTSSTGVSAP